MGETWALGLWRHLLCPVSQLLSVESMMCSHCLGWNCSSLFLNILSLAWCSLHRAQQNLHYYSWECWLTCDKGHYFFSALVSEQHMCVSLLWPFLLVHISPCFFLCTPFSHFPLWDSGCDDLDWPFWSQIGEGFLWIHPHHHQNELLKGGTVQGESLLRYLPS